MESPLRPTFKINFSGLGPRACVGQRAGARNASQIRPYPYTASSPHTETFHITSVRCPRKQRHALASAGRGYLQGRTGNRTRGARGAISFWIPVPNPWLFHESPTVCRAASGRRVGWVLRCNSYPRSARAWGGGARPGAPGREGAAAARRGSSLHK